MRGGLTREFEPPVHPRYRGYLPCRDKEDLGLSRSWSHTSKSVPGMNITVFWEKTDDSFKTQPVKQSGALPFTDDGREC